MWLKLHPKDPTMNPIRIHITQLVVKWKGLKYLIFGSVGGEENKKVEDKMNKTTKDISSNLRADSMMSPVYVRS